MKIMKTINIYDAKSQLSELIRRVQKGERIVIAKAGVPVADLTPHIDAVPRVRFGVAAGRFAKPIADKAIMGADGDIQKLFYGEAL